MQHHHQQEKQKQGSLDPEPSWWHSLGNQEYCYWLTRATLYEFFGTLIMIYLQAASGETLAVSGAPAFVNDALGHGFAAFIATYIAVHVTGAIFNPALTLGLWLTQRIDFLTMTWFTAAQVAGSFAAAGLLRASIGTLTAGLGVPRLVSGLLVGHGLLIQATLGFFLLWITAMVFLRGRYYFYRNRYRFHYGGLPADNVHAALVALGWNAGVEAAFVTTVGSGPNPVRWLGPAVISGRYVDWPVWIAGPYIGVLFGVAVYLFDVVVLRPDRQRVDANYGRKADLAQREVQGTRSVKAPKPPMFQRDREPGLAVF